MVFVKWFFFFCNPDVLRRRFADCFVGVPWGLTFLAPPFYLSNKKVIPTCMGTTSKMMVK